MEIEKQRWAPLPSSCAPQLDNLSPFYGSGKSGVLTWIPDVEFGQALANLAEKAVLCTIVVHDWEPYTGCYLAKRCTEFASYPYPNTVRSGSAAHIVQKLNEDFDGKGARIIDLDLPPGFPDNTTGLSKNMTALLVPNFGPAAKAWWWSGSAGATASEVADVINGKAWAAGNFKNDGKKKKIVAIERSKQDGKFRFVLNEWKPGEAWWWGHGASIANITKVINGEAWGDFKADGIEKRLVSLKRHLGDNWTFLAVPREGVNWWWFPKIAYPDILVNAQQLNARVIDIEEWGGDNKDDVGGFNVDTALLVQNT